MNHVQKFMADMEANIASTGRSLIGTEGYCGLFAYTIGHADKDLPDLIVTGMNRSSASYLLNTVGDMLYAAKDKGTPLSNEIDLGHIKLQIKPAAHANQTHAFQTRYREEAKGKELQEMLQIVWPDQKGNFPGDTEYDVTKLPQPLFVDHADEWLAEWLAEERHNKD